ncbi:MAG TPA: hypothetical protein DEQ98_10755 [Acidobacteria bacterium]|nr:hypothetical protein [Acidobacteriota bacterium]HCE03707.1 hypothetical protein [Acidobacteriota bacterium]
MHQRRILRDHAVGALDIGLSQFHGTSRDPRFLPNIPGGEAARRALLGVLLAGVALLLVYDVID